MPDIDINALPADVEVLRAIIVANQLEHDKALKTERAKVSALEQHITNLEHQLAALRRARFGSSSEQLDEHIYQLELMLEELQSAKADRVVESEPASPENKPKPKARKPLPEHLPRETIEHGTHNAPCVRIVDLCLRVDS